MKKEITMYPACRMVFNSLVRRNLLVAAFFLLQSGLFAATWFVKPAGDDSNTGTSWGQAFLTIQKALQTAGAGDQIWVAAGIYYPDEGPGQTDNNTGASFQLVSNVGLYGGFTGSETLLTQRNWMVNETVLDGDINQNASSSGNSINVVRAQNVGSSTVLDGFTIRNGYASSSNGSGLLNSASGAGNVSSPVIANCLFTQNTGSNGGAVYNSASSSGIAGTTFTHCVFTNNYASGSGGAIWNNSTTDGDCSPIITHCSFIGNYSSFNAGAVNNDGSSNSSVNPVFTNCIFLGNSTARYGGAVTSDAHGGTSLPLMTNCTFSGNYAGLGGAVLRNNNGAISTLTNCILWGNSSLFSELNSPVPVIDHSIVEGGYAGDGNLDADPLFVQQPNYNFAPTSSGDLHLTACSPAINSATPTGAPGTDLEDAPRPAQGGFDLGAFEFQSAIVLVTCYLDSDSDGYGNPAVSQEFCAECAAGYVTDNTDCDDSDMNAFPITWYRDSDSDNFGDPAVSQSACTQPTGYVADNTDCNDNDPLQKPGQTWYKDADNDGYSDGATLTQCLRPNGYKTAAELTGADLDCDDGEPAVNPGATEICDGIDNNCDGNTDDEDPALVDNTPPTALCRNITIQLDSEGAYTLQPEEVDNGSYDACGIQSAVLSQQSFGCADTGNNTATLTVTDIKDNSSSCTAVVTVEDRTPPVALCRNLTVYLDADGQFEITPDELNNGSNDACGLSEEAPFGTNLVKFECENIGENTVTLTVTDANGNSSTCTATITVADNTDPVINCTDATVSLNGEAALELDAGSLAAASDNCGVESLEAGLPAVSCEDLGEVIPVIVTATDAAGNSANCVSHITVTGLPCGWSQSPDGIGCTDGSEAAYDSPSGTFTLMANGCYTPGVTNDESAYVGTEICGDGSITAHIAGLTLPGFAGIVMRETTSPGAKKVALVYQGVNALQRFVRYADNSPSYPSYISTPGSRWLRIVRTGNLFKGYHSVNGVTWTYAFAVTVPMNACIQVGLITSGANSNSVVTATFDNVVIDPPYGANQQKYGIDPAFSEAGRPRVELWPNPAAGEATLNLEHFLNRGSDSATIEVTDEFGRLVRRLKTSESRVALRLNDQAPGLYLVRITGDDGTTRVLKLVIGR
ncbi:MAG: T9SS type A sorting domain-containing protein [Lewinellaceae bacterium]|nr:T9SS type A sorting domain-containing protein [Lewinellaceae bacterium]